MSSEQPGNRPGYPFCNHSRGDPHGQIYSINRQTANNSDNPNLHSQPFLAPDRNLNLTVMNHNGYENYGSMLQHPSVSQHHETAPPPVFHPMFYHHTPVRDQNSLVVDTTRVGPLLPPPPYLPPPPPIRQYAVPIRTVVPTPTPDNVDFVMPQEEFKREKINQYSLKSQRRRRKMKNKQKRKMKKQERMALQRKVEMQKKDNGRKRRSQNDERNDQLRLLSPRNKVIGLQEQIEQKQSDRVVDVNFSNGDLSGSNHRRYHNDQYKNGEEALMSSMQIQNMKVPEKDNFQYDDMEISLSEEDMDISVSSGEGWSKSMRKESITEIPISDDCNHEVPKEEGGRLDSLSKPSPLVKSLTETDKTESNTGCLENCSNFRKQSKETSSVSEELVMNPSKTTTTDSNGNEEHSENLLKKRNRLKQELKKAALKNAKARLAFAHLRKKEALQMAKAELASGTLRKEDALKIYQKKAIKKPVSALRIKSLLLSGIGSSGPDGKVRHRTLESISISINRDSNSPKDLEHISARDPDKVKLPSLCSAAAAKLRLDLELAKRKLKLAELQSANTKKLGNKPFSDNSSADVKGDKEASQDEALETTAKGVTRLPIAKTEDLPTKVETVHDLLKRQKQLRESIMASKEVHKELKYEQDISNLRDMIDKQKILLGRHLETVRSCTLSMRTCEQTLEEEKRQRANSQLELEKLSRNKTTTENMVRSVTGKIMRLRRKRSK